MLLEVFPLHKGRQADHPLLCVQELSMDVPDLLASLLELGSAPTPAGKSSPAPLRSHQQQHRGAHSGGGRGEQQWGDNDSAHSAEAAAPRRGSRSERQVARAGPGHAAAQPPAGVDGGDQWDGREQWDAHAVGNGGGRRAAGDSSGSLPLHEVWMQHEGEWANVHGLRPPASQVRALSSQTS